jgi:glycolate oxidase FAD binding subunit
MRKSLRSFADEVGPDGPVTVAGGKTQWEIGGVPAPGTREVSAPVGVVAYEPAEMIVRVGAGTSLAEVGSTIKEGGQFVALEADDPSHATVGGVLAVGRSGYRRLGWGHVRDSVLEMTSVSARGEVIRSGAPLVKNVTGYDLCRLWVGSLGTLALTGEVVLRCLPIPRAETWWVGRDTDPFAVASQLYRPLSVLWDGEQTWVGLAGHRVDVEDQARTILGPHFLPTDGPPPLPGALRRSLLPRALKGLPSQAGVGAGWLAQVGVGVVHCSADAAERIGPVVPPSLEVSELQRAVKERFDPAGRLNPGRSASRAAQGASA